jgi:hypothetical protein
MKSPQAPETKVAIAVAIVIGAVIVLAVIGSLVNKNDRPSAQYTQWRAECEAAADHLAEAAGGGPVDPASRVKFINVCLLAKADAAP